MKNIFNAEQIMEKEGHLVADGRTAMMWHFTLGFIKDENRTSNRESVALEGNHSKAYLLSKMHHKLNGNLKYFEECETQTLVRYQQLYKQFPNIRGNGNCAKVHEACK